MLDVMKVLVVASPYKELQKEMPQLRALRALLMAKSPSDQDLVDTLSFISYVGEGKLVDFIEGFESVGIVGGFEKVQKQLGELQQCLNDILAQNHGVLLTVKTSEPYHGILLEKDTRVKVVKCITELEYLSDGKITN